MSLPDERGAVSIAVESLAMPLSAVRLERRADAPPQTLSIRLEYGALVVTCGSSAFIETADRGPHAGRHILRDGHLAIRVERVSTPAFDADVRPPRSRVPDRLPRLLSGPSRTTRMEVEEAEWQEVTPTDCTRVDLPSEIDARRAASAASARGVRSSRPADAGDAPTRIQILDGETVFEDARAAVSPARSRPPPFAPPPSRAVASAPPVAPPRIRPGVRRFALVAMLAASFLLWLHAYRARHGQAAAKGLAAPTHASSAAGSASAIGAGSLLPASSAGAGALRIPSLSEAAQGANTGALIAPRRSGVSRERVAADALANGAYADALALYEALAGEPGSNPAFAHVAQSLRARTTERAP